MYIIKANCTILLFVFTYLFITLNNCDLSIVLLIVREEECDLSIVLLSFPRI